MKNQKNLLKLRKKINCIDKSLLKLLYKRNLISKKIIKEKIKSNYPIQDSIREKEIFRKITSKGKKYNLNEKYIKKIFQTIIINSVKIQKKIYQKKKSKILKMSFLGPKGSYSYLAASKYAKKKTKFFMKFHVKRFLKF
ncbi:chorismate mutase [Buchnera aphidicola]|uniref:chorismate mutase n=1 Tax=Buchnera aphidicola TaxID=9 RepID=UPI002238F5F2|nr:chorismate mutase [Buchnera aphidicola]MCW5197570.1 chorismate mutase [Buchnera aphidicola (Chaitophorus viminalis)]